MNLHFVDNLTDAYDNFTERLLTSDRDFIAIGNEMDWQTLINKAAEVELKARVRGSRTTAYKASTSSCSAGCTHGCSAPSEVQAHIADTDPKTAALNAARQALAKAKAEAWCDLCKVFRHLTKECWKNGKAEPPPHIKKRRAQEQKKKEEAKKAKTDQKAQANVGFVEDDEEVLYACMAKVEETKLRQDVPRTKGFYHYLDSRAGRHLSGDSDYFGPLSKLERPVVVSGFNGKTVVTQSSTLSLNIAVDNHSRPLVIHNVLFVPGLPFSLISVKALARKGLRTTFDEEDCQVVRKSDHHVVAEGVSQTATDLYRLVLSDDTPSGTHENAYHAAVTSSGFPVTQAKEVDINVAHQRLGHLSEGHLRCLPKVSRGLQLKGKFTFCKECALAKQTRRNFTARPTRYTTRLTRIHMDLSGPHPVSARGERYFLMLLDKATRLRWVKFLKQKSDVPGIIRDFLTEVENQTEQKVKRWHSDNRGEFISKLMEGIAKAHSIIHEPTAPYNPEQNGSTERSMYTI